MKKSKKRKKDNERKERIKEGWRGRIEEGS